MTKDISLTNLSFDYLKGSNDFLNTVLNNISSCVLLLNNRMELQAFNDAMKTIFTNKPNEDLLYKKCGDAIGCAYAVEEASECGTTSHCKFCELRASAILAYSENKIICKEQLSRAYYNNKGKKVLKHLQYSVRPFSYLNERYVLVVVDDVTKYFEQEEIIISQIKEIKNLKEKCEE